TIIGCVVLPPLADWLGRRATLAAYFGVMLLSIAIGFGYIFYLRQALAPFMAILFVLGIGGGDFVLFTPWVPAQESTAVRASARAGWPLGPRSAASSAPASRFSSARASRTTTPLERRSR